MNSRPLKAICMTVFALCFNASAVRIVVDFGTGFDSPSANVTFCQEGILDAISSILEPQLGGSVTLRLKAEILELPANVAAQGGSVSLTHKFVDPLHPIPGLLPGRWYSLALASECSGVDLKATSGVHAGYHMILAINQKLVEDSEFWFYYDRVSPTNKIDYLSVVLHEIAHGLGFHSVAALDGHYVQDMTSTFDLNLSGNISPEPDMFTFEQLGVTGREQVIRGGDVWWSGSAVSTVGLIKRQSFPPDNAFHPNYFSAEMMTPITESTIESTIAHWHKSHSNPEQLMEPSFQDALGCFMVREIGLLGPALIDMGWPDMTLFSSTPTSLRFAPASSNKGISNPQTVVVCNYRNGITNVTQVEIFGEHAGSFVIVSGGIPGTLSYLQSRYIKIGFNPGSVGYKMATLRISYNDGADKYAEVSLEGFGILTDSDDDGISDFDETRELYGLTNPFNWQVADSTGEDEEATGDGVDDGYNDFDGDGMSNREEFIFGYNPIDPSNYGVRTVYDTDGDGILDEDEREDPFGPFDPYIGDTSGNYFSDAPDGIPDGQNDYDGDGLDNAFEYRWGTNPLEPDYDIKIPATSFLSVGVAVLSALFFGVLRLNRRRGKCNAFSRHARQ